MKEGQPRTGNTDTDDDGVVSEGRRRTRQTGVEGRGGAGDFFFHPALWALCLSLSPSPPQTRYDMGKEPCRQWPTAAISLSLSVSPQAGSSIVTQDSGDLEYHPPVHHHQPLYPTPTKQAWPALPQGHPSIHHLELQDPEPSSLSSSPFYDCG
jgi:hypothetical protein